MRRDNRPYWLLKALEHLDALYARRILHPQFESIGAGATFVHPRALELIGPGISAGNHFQAIAAPDRPIRLFCYNDGAVRGEIRIGHCNVLSPGVRLSSATRISIGDGCMIAQQAYITDADWHGLYERIYPPGATACVRLGNNVWIGDGATICKGVEIGDNSVVGAGAVVVRSIPPNVVATGNPARPVRELDPDRPMLTRMDLFRDPSAYARFADDYARSRTQGNTLLGWLRSLYAPSKDS